MRRPRCVVICPRPVHTACALILGLALPAIGFIIAGTALAIMYHHRLVDLLQDAKPELPTTASFPRH